MNRWLALSIAGGLAAGAVTLPAQSGRGHGEEAYNTRLVGAHDLQGRSAYQPLPVRQGERRILYVGHHAGEALNPLTGAVETNGTSVVDVTAPEAPVYLAHIPATGGASGSQMVQVCAGDQLPRGQAGRFYLLRPNGNRSQEIWDVTAPASPAFVRTVVETGRTPAGDQHTHKNWWECDTGIAHLVGTVDGWRAPRILQVFDLADPAAPRHVRDFSLPGVQPDASGPIPGGSGLHEAVRLGNRLYLAYGTVANGVVQILDRDRLLNGDPDAAAPLAASPAALAYPQIGRLDVGDDVEIGANTAIDRGALDATVIQRGAKLDNLVQIAHNVSVGEHCALSAQVGVAGSSRVEAGAILAGQAGIADHVTIGEGAIVGAQAGVPTGKRIRPKQIVWGTPARPLDEFKTQYAAASRLPKWKAELDALKAKVADLEARLGSSS